MPVRRPLWLCVALMGLLACDPQRALTPEPPREDPLGAAQQAIASSAWDDAIAQAQLAINADIAVEEAQAILDKAKAEKQAYSLIQQADALLALEQYDKAFYKVSLVPKDSVYSVRASNISIIIRQALVLPPRLRRGGDVEMVRFVIGTFKQGSSEADLRFALSLCEESGGDCERKWFTREAPQRTVTLASYYIDTHAVTNRHFNACVAAAACTPPDWDECGLTPELRQDFTAADQPQVCVTWQQAADYCAWSGARLPTEAEWERAARGERGRRFPWGNTFHSHAANWSDGDGTIDGYRHPAPVKAYPPCAHGLYQMAGNVYEWTQDWWDERAYRDTPNRDPRGPKEGTNKVIRGGAYNRAPVDLRAAHRNRMPPTMADKAVGWRCALSATDIFPFVHQPLAPEPVHPTPDSAAPSPSP